MAKRSGGLRFQPTGGARPPRNQRLPAGKKQRLEIQKLADDGRGIAHEGGRTWFVSGALPGEQVEARVLACRSQVVDARCEQVLVASELRRAPFCPLAGECGGCSLQHLPHAEQLALKQQTLASQLQRLAGIAPQQWAAPLSCGERDYRRRARLAVRCTEAGQLQVGFRASASQSIVDLDACPVLVQALQTVLAALPACLRSLQKPQAIGHVELFEGSALAMLVRHVRPLPEADQQALRAFCASQQVQLWWQGDTGPQPDQPGTVLDYRLEAEGLSLECRPGDFVQVNAAMNEAMLVQAMDWLAPQSGERILDLFCGLGNFSLPLARRAAAVVGVEGVTEMVERARQNAARNALDNLEFRRADLSQPLEGRWLQQGFDAVLLDPPRDGAAGVTGQLAELGASRVLYVSCNPATLARDAASLAAQGFRLERAGILDMFPQTAHVEAMALFTRA